jgi:hypothetical protein
MVSRLHPVVAGLLFLSPLSLGQAQVSGQSFQVIPETDRATVGDSVTVGFRVRLDERDLLFDTVPAPLDPMRRGVRLLSVEKMTRSPDRIFHGRARLIFYRPGRQAIPVFGLPFMRSVKGVHRGTLASDSAFVEIVSLLPAGNPSLKDIAETGMSSTPELWPFAVAGAVGLLLTLTLSRRRKIRPRPFSDEAPVVVQSAPTPYAEAVAKLDRIEREGWPGLGQIERHYESVVDVLRDYLESKEEIPARECTSAELLWALSPHLSEGGRRDSLRDLLDEADRVKFALFRPTSAGAGRFLGEARSLLEQWHRAALSPAADDAVR